MKQKLFRHYKGNIYKFISEGTHTETGERFVVYRDWKDHVWIRPAEMFYGEVEINGKMQKRFTFEK